MVTRFFHEYLFKLAVTVAVISTTATFALIKTYWTWPNAVVGVVLLASGLWYLMDQLGIGPSTKSRVRDWLDSSGYDVQTIQDANEFHFRVTDNVGMKTGVLQIKAGAPILIASPQHIATPGQLAAFNSMTDSERRGFWTTVKLDLLRYRVAFSDLKLDGDGVTFSDNVVVTRTLSATEFLQRLFFVRSGARLYQELLHGILDAPQSAVAIAQVTGDQPLRRMPPPG